MDNNGTVLDNLLESEAKLLNGIIMARSTDALEHIVWYSNADSRKAMADRLNVSDIRIKQLLKSLTDKGVLICKVRGSYKVADKYMQVGKEK